MVRQDDRARHRQITRPHRTRLHRHRRRARQTQRHRRPRQRPRTAGAGRDVGTSIHSAAEILDYGADISSSRLMSATTPKAMSSPGPGPDLEPYCGEVFVANRQLKAAGSFDRPCTATRPATRSSATSRPAPKTTPNTPPATVRRAGVVHAAGHLRHRASLRQRLAQMGRMGPSCPSAMRGVIFYIPRSTGNCYVIDIDLAQGLQAVKLRRRRPRRACILTRPGIRGAA